MIDGVKIHVPSHTATQWLSNKLLKFGTFSSVETGEMLGNTITANYKALEFRIRFFDTGEVKEGLVSGSLHKYWNKGNHNYNDFTFFDLQNVINDLTKTFTINPKVSTLQNLEFGVNIYTPIPAKELTKNVLAYKNYSLTFFNAKRKRIGKRMEQQQNVLKIYDKGKLENIADNLVRFEMKALKSAYLKPYNIKTLSDLTDISKIQQLGGTLICFWNDVVYHDKKINYRALTNYQQKKYLYWGDCRNWEHYTKKQRYTNKKQLNQLFKQYGINTHAEIGKLIDQKSKELTAQKRVLINHFSECTNQHKKGYELTEYVNGYSVPKTPPKNDINILPENTTKKTTKKRCTCKVCKTDIKHRRVGAKYCSKKCNNKYNGMKRTQKNRKSIAKEKEDLQRLICILPKRRTWLMVSYKTDNGIYTDTLKQTEITTSINWIKKVQKVLVTEYRKNASPIILTNYRARKLLTEINKLNLKP
ncbi:conserved hypothetical protein [Tenacibaculum maritimum]|uniref:hypothetical protein n=1 Tax=Tenacibaculum maritimum TaxID=107401 RepID=UPI0012E6592D|nr:hypothetical protein [Tenacibaculum maritimum]CAA0159745.1 conserved hypothetical protein [Tenacibaculum maritimum]CAA0230812.1 conserved hypothetical protein [Tenacibaculum maritimum]